MLSLIWLLFLFFCYYFRYDNRKKLYWGQLRKTILPPKIYFTFLLWDHQIFFIQAIYILLFYLMCFHTWHLCDTQKWQRLIATFHVQWCLYMSAVWCVFITIIYKRYINMFWDKWKSVTLMSWINITHYYNKASNQSEVS